jgi:flagellar motility protein MotE (MotC chaperone)
MGPHTDTTPTERFFTRKQAAELCSVSTDTIKRAQKHGKLPGARPRLGCRNGTTEIPYTDLVNAGLCQPLTAGDEPEQQLARLQDAQRLQELTEQVVRLQALHDERAERLRALERHNEQLLRTIEQLAAGLAGGGR